MGLFIRHYVKIRALLPQSLWSGSRLKCGKSKNEGLRADGQNALEIGISWSEGVLKKGNFHTTFFFYFCPDGYWQVHHFFDGHGWTRSRIWPICCHVQASRSILFLWICIDCCRKFACPLLPICHLFLAIFVRPRRVLVPSCPVLHGAAEAGKRGMKARARWHWQRGRIGTEGPSVRD